MYPNLARNAGSSMRETHGMNHSDVGTLSEARQPEISNQLDRLAKTIEYAEHSFNELQARCAPVARSETPATDTNKVSPREVLQTPVATAIQCAVDRAQDLGDRIQSLIRRFEV